MSLIPIPAELLPFGETLAFPLRDSEGRLLMGAGHLLRDTPQVQALVLRGVYVHMDEIDAASRQRVAEVTPDAPDTDFDFDHLRSQDLGTTGVWADLQQRTHALLSNPRAEDFLPRLDRIHDEAVAQVLRAPDATLTCLIHDAGQQSPNYSARHGLLCLALGELCGQQMVWPEPWRHALTHAALSMNVAIVREQDQLAAQAERISTQQLETIRGHGDRAARFLARLGVRQSLRLDAVRLHHDTEPGQIDGREPARQLARLLARIDVFAAQLSPRRTRLARSSAHAARAVYLDEKQQPDEAGAALVRTVGLYPPGSFVRLASGEIGMVYKRGERTTAPYVAALTDVSGQPLPRPQPRETGVADNAVVESLAPHEFRLPVDMAALLRL